MAVNLTNSGLILLPVNPKMNSVENLVERISSLPKKDHILLIAIDGRGGSGKTTLAEKLRDSSPDVTLVTLDDFYSPTLGRADRQRVIDQLINPLRKNKTARYQRFNWKTKKLSDWIEVEPEGIIIIEGVSTLHSDFDGLFDFKIWIECPPEVGFKRGLTRDLSNNGQDTTDEWLNVWIPEEKEYVETEKPQEKADFIFNCLEETSKPKNIFRKSFIIKK